MNTTKGMLLVVLSCWASPSCAGKDVSGQTPDPIPKPVPQPVPQSDLTLTIAGVQVTLKYIPSGEYQMGCLSGENNCDDDEKPAHKVAITQGFYMMQTEVTQRLYQAVMTENPSYFSACGLDCPVEQVSWEDAQSFAQKLSSLVGVHGAFQRRNNGNGPHVGARSSSMQGTMRSGMLLGMVTIVEVPRTL